MMPPMALIGCPACRCLGGTRGRTDVNIAKNQDVRKVWEQIAGRMAIAASILVFIGGVSGELASAAMRPMKPTRSHCGRVIP